MALFTLKQLTSGHTLAVASQNLAFVSNNAVGNLLLCMTRITHSTGSTPGTASIADSKVNAWATAFSIVNGTDTFYLFYAMNCKAGANTVTLSSTNGGNCFFGTVIAEYSGAALTSALLTSNTNGPSSTQPVNSGNVVTGAGNPNVLLIAGCSNETANALTFTSLTGGFTSEGNDNGNIFFCDSQKTSAGTFALGGTLSNGAVQWVSGIAVFLPPASVGVTGSSFVQGFRGFVNKRGMTSHLRPR